MRNALTALTLLVGLSLATVASAHGPDGRRGPPPPMGPLLHGLQELDLDAGQQAQLDDALEAMEATRPERPERGERPERPSEADRQAMHAERQARAEALETELAAANPDRELLHAQLDNGPHGAAPNVAHEHLDLLLDVHATLDDGQRAQLVGNLSERRAEHAERRKDCEGGRRGSREE